MAHPFVLRRKLATVAVLAALMFSAKAAHADGLVCVSVDEDTRIDVYLAPASPTDHATKIVSRLEISDPNRTPAHRLIATFDVADGVLATNGGDVLATVDLSKAGSSRAGQRVGGTRLGSLKSILLDIDISYEEPIDQGTRYAAEVTYAKKNGEKLHQDFDCSYFPNQSPNTVSIKP